MTKPSESGNPNGYKWIHKKWTCMAVIALVIFVAFVIFVSYAATQAYASLQGYWKYDDSTYLLINDKQVQLVQFSDCKQYVLHDDPDVCFTLRSYFQLSNHEMSMKVSDEKIISEIDFLDCMNSKIYITPILGIMQIIRQDGQIISLIKDNEMTIEYLSITE